MACGPCSVLRVCFREKDGMRALINVDIFQLHNYNLFNMLQTCMYTIIYIYNHDSL